MKKILISLILAICCFAAVFAGCGQNKDNGADDDPKTAAIIKAYWEYKEDRYKDREKRLTIYYIGTYKSNEILEIKCDVEGVDVIAVEVPVIINDVLIRYLPDPRYDLMLYTQELKCISVYDAYAIGMITDADLSELAEICSNYDK